MNQTWRAKRIYVSDSAYPDDIEKLLAAGEYAQCLMFPQLWLFKAPNGDPATINNVATPTGCIVIEHEDKTVSIGPASIQFRTGNKWHGYLHHDVWSLQP